MKESILGSWPAECVQRTFVEGAAWWQFHTNGATMFSSERTEAEAEAVRRYGVPRGFPITREDLENEPPVEPDTEKHELIL